jgi:hypothetical protein
MGCLQTSAGPPQTQHYYACTYCGQKYYDFNECAEHEKSECSKRPQLTREDSDEFVKGGGKNNKSSTSDLGVPAITDEEATEFISAVQACGKMEDLIQTARLWRARLTTASLKMCPPAILMKVCKGLSAAAAVSQPMIDAELERYASFCVAWIPKGASAKSCSSQTFPARQDAEAHFKRHAGGVDAILLMTDAAEELDFAGSRQTFDILKKACMKARGEAYEPPPQFAQATVTVPPGKKAGTQFGWKTPAGDTIMLVVPEREAKWGMEVSYPVPAPPQPGKASCLVVTKNLCSILSAVDDAAPMPATKGTLHFKAVAEAICKIHSKVVVRTGVRHAKQAMLFARQLGVTGLPELEAVTRVMTEELRFPEWWDLSIMEGLDMKDVQAFQNVQKGDITNLYGTISLGDEDVDRIQKLFDASFVAKYTRDRKGGQVPKRLAVQKAMRVQNAQNWAEYINRTAEIRTELDAMRKRGGQIMDKVDRLKTAIPEFTTDRSFQLDASTNDAWLFHGTTAGEAIAQSDFRIDLSGTNAGTLYGRGVYLAESCAKSDEYSNEDAQGCRQIVICRTVLGSILYSDDIAPNPYELERKCMSGEYHCVLGDREKTRGTFREFIVFDEDQVYPEFVVWYKREY